MSIEMSSVQNAAAAVGLAMGSNKYAIVGDAACCLLGSGSAQHLDFVVPRGKTVETRRRLRDSSGFVIEPRTNYTKFDLVDVQILTPPVLFQQEFDETTPTIEIYGIQVLKPALVLNAKCHALVHGYSDDKRRADAEDVLFLLDYHVQRSITISAAEVPTATKLFVLTFIRICGRRDLWKAAGYKMDRGEWLDNYLLETDPSRKLLIHRTRKGHL